MSFELEVTPEDDCAVLFDKPGENWDKWGLAYGNWDGGIYQSCLRFNLSGLGIEADDISAARLKLYGKAVFPDTAAFLWFLEGDWNEETVTAYTRPDLKYLNGEGYIGGAYVSETLGWTEIPIDVAFIKDRLGANLNMLLYGYEVAPNRYGYADDREAGAGEYAPRAPFQVEPVLPDLKRLAVGVAGAAPALFTLGVVAAQEIKKLKII